MSFINGNAVADSDALATLELPVGGVEPGTRVFNESTASYFVYTLSTAALVTDVVVAANGITGARWIVEPTAISPAQVDLADETANLTPGATVGMYRLRQGTLTDDQVVTVQNTSAVNTQQLIFLVEDTGDFSLTIKNQGASTLYVHAAGDGPTAYVIYFATNTWVAERFYPTT